MVRIAQTPERYLRSPRLWRSKDGIELHLIAWNTAEDSEDLLVYSLEADGSVVDEPRRRHSGAQIPAMDADGRPADFRAEYRASDGAASVEVRNVGGVAEVILSREDGEHVVWRAVGSAAAPALVSAPKGTWVAWHTDVREDTGNADIAKWIVLRYVDADGRVLAPAAPMKDRDRDLNGEEQSWEFPALGISEAGAVTLFGRGSHNFWRQDLSDAGWSDRTPLCDGSWGSRGRRITAIRLDDGQWLTARRDRRGIEVDRLAKTEGGFPSLVPVEVGTCSAPEKTREPRDPALRRGLATYFGDIQQHSAHSDGVGSADEAYLRARHRYHDDFVALTDHESFLGKRTGPGEWEYLQQVADAHDEPGEFATLLAYEWTGKMYPGPGHKCVYLPKRGMKIVSRDDRPEGRDAVQALKEMGAIASPHHIGWTGCDEEGHDPVGQPVWEICSCHGCYEHADHPLGMRGEHKHQLADVMLKKGHRFGFTASSDSHGLLWHHGEARKRDPYRTGLTAVQCAELTRDAIFEALRTRRCYGTSGAKIFLDVAVDGNPMGSEIHADGAVKVWASAVGAEAIARIDIVTEEDVVATFPGSGDELTIETSVTGRYVYVRVVQEDGEMAWSSPVFID